MLKLFGLTFITIFLAELGDKTQLATLLLAAKTSQRLVIFLASASALVLTSALGVLIGKFLGEQLPLQLIRYFSGLLFLVLGILILLGKI